MKLKTACTSFIILYTHLASFGQTKYHEQYRPQVHFSPQQHWMNDPNGMVYSNNTYHLFFQYYPDSTVWGPMHWGHATSGDLIHWQQQPVALYPDSLGYIFSGSAVADMNNTSGFGKSGKVALVAVFTQHDPAGEKAGNNNFQNQSIAYSNDDGKTWIKYKGNPVVKNPGITDFRDPKITWYAPEKKWIMTLATKDRVTFYSSPDLKHWEKESEFGEHAGAHGGVWECPDLFTLNYKGKKIWILTVSLNPGGPNNGSATQYFTGHFNGTTFIANSNETKRIDYGPDNYAGVTWSKTGNRKIFLGWMSNWLYATKVPTITWRSAMTLPRELQLIKLNDEMYIASMPVKELSKIATGIIDKKNISVYNTLIIDKLMKQPVSFPCTLDVNIDTLKDISIVLFNDKNEKLVIGFNAKMNQYFIDRTQSGFTSFDTAFAAKSVAHRISNNHHINLSIVADESSVELFADNGLSVMTSLFFPTKNYNHIEIRSTGTLVLNNLRYKTLKSIWK